MDEDDGDYGDKDSEWMVLTIDNPALFTSPRLFPVTSRHLAHPQFVPDNHQHRGFLNIWEGGRRRIPEHIWSAEQSQTFSW